MAIEQAKVGEVAARMMEALDQHGYGEDAEITDVMLVVAVGHNTEPGARSTNVHWTDPLYPFPALYDRHIAATLS